MSGTIRFISDPHFGHKNMAIKRGFPDSYCHDENIIAQWNAVVNKRYYMDFGRYYYGEK